MFRYPLVTKQTGDEGQKVSKVLVVQAAAKIAREVYVGVVLDRAIGLPIVMACAEGGVEIEEVAAQHPEKILKRTIDPDAGIHPFQARRLAYDLGFLGEQAPKAEKIITALANVFLDKDCSLAEINPLVTTADGDVQVLDAKITFDDNALFRHPELVRMRDETEEDPAEMRAASSGLSYINLTGTIGCLVNGAGLAMSTMDIIKYHGGFPANFLDVGGGANKEQVTEAFRILLADSPRQGGAGEHLRRHYEVRHHRRRHHRRVQGSRLSCAAGGASGRNQRGAGQKDVGGKRLEHRHGRRLDGSGEEGRGGGQDFSLAHWANQRG